MKYSRLQDAECTTHVSAVLAKGFIWTSLSTADPNNSCLAATMYNSSPAPYRPHGSGLSETKRETPSFPVPHPDYYFEDGNLTILVENTLFKLFRSTFTRHSSVFKDLFSLPTSQSGTPVEGCDDDNPLQFSGISTTDFERLIWVLYPPSYESPKAQTVDEWRSVLSLATRWEFTGVRALAIRSLQSLDITPVERILLAQEFDIPGRWALPAYVALCERPEPLSLGEAALLGLETSVRIAQLREQLRARGHRSASMGGYHSLTRSAAARQGGPSTSSGKVSVAARPATSPAGASERARWGIAKSFLAPGELSPPARANGSGSRKAGAKMPSTSIPGTSRLVAQMFGIELGR
ncbi:hypothetical protein GY45DRAFT_754913 [Cubamyces sp. BRFM 1775]|nr:hypothetical protein GY45DRAFT_754913 [Cubamyces sp. BRFM 1775]